MPKTRPDGQGRLMFGVFLAVVAAVVLLDRYDLFDMDWVYEWWPVPVFLLGVYFIGAAVWDRMRRRTCRSRRRIPTTTDRRFQRNQNAPATPGRFIEAASVPS